MCSPQIYKALLNFWIPKGALKCLMDECCLQNVSSPSSKRGSGTQGKILKLHHSVTGMGNVSQTWSWAGYLLMVILLFPLPPSESQANNCYPWVPDTQQVNSPVPPPCPTCAPGSQDHGRQQKCLPISRLYLLNPCSAIVLRKLSVYLHLVYLTHSYRYKRYFGISCF